MRFVGFQWRFWRTMAKLLFGGTVKKGNDTIFSEQGVTFSGLSVSAPHKISTKANITSAIDRISIRWNIPAF